MSTTTTGMLRWHQIIHLPARGMRWVPTAAEVAFPTPRLSWFFALGGSAPVVRGDGVYQRVMDFCLQALDRGGWVHVFPEGVQGGGFLYLCQY